jgi:hypothetical protein
MLDFGKPPTVTAAVGAYSNSTFLTNGPPLIAGCSHCAQIDGSDPSAGYGASGPTAPCGCHTEMAIPLHSRHAGDPLYGRCALPPNLTGTTFSANANLDFGVAFIALRATPGSTTPAEVNALCMQHTYIFEDRHTYIHYTACASGILPRRLLALQRTGALCRAGSDGAGVCQRM